MRNEIFDINDLTFQNMLKKYNEYFKVDHSHTLTSVGFNIEHMYTVEPFAMLMFINKFEIFKKEYPELERKMIGYNEQVSAHTYAGHMGFYKSFGVELGKNPGEARGSDTYIPIEIFNKRDLHTLAYEKGVAVQEILEEKSLKMAEVLCQDNEQIKNSMHKCLTEILRNAFEHSESEKIYIVAQRKNFEGTIEVAILDEGVGVKQAIHVNPHLKTIIDTNSEKDALGIAVEPSISGKAFKHKGIERGQIDGRWDHSGFGLYITSEICRRNGSFSVCSGNTIMIMTNEDVTYKNLQLKGTAVRIKLNINSLKNFTQKDIEQIIEDGQEKAAENYSKFSLTRASSASKKTLLSTKK